MAKEDKDDIRRVEFILNENELQFERNESKSLFDGLDVSPEAIIENPMNLMMSNFDNEYMKNERIGVVLFEAMNESMRKYQNMVNQNFYYQDMEIVQRVNDLLMRYNTWLINQRGLILNTRDMVKEIKEMVDSEYVTKKSVEKSQEDFQKEMKLQVEEDKKEMKKQLAEGLYVGRVGEMNNKKVLIIPEDRAIKVGELVDYRKSKDEDKK